MSQYADLMAVVGVPVLLDHHGQQITVTPAGGSATTPTAIVSDETAREIEDDLGRRLQRTRSVMLSTDAAGDYGGVANAALQSVVAIGGVDYAIEAVGPEGDGLVTLELVRIEDLEIAPTHYRRHRS